MKKILHNNRGSNWCRCLYFGMVLVSVAALKNPCRAEDAREALKQRFLKEAPAAWDSYEKYAHRLQGSYLSLEHNDPPGKDSMHSRVEYKSNQDSELFIMQSLLKDKKWRCPSDKPKVCFQAVAKKRRTSLGVGSSQCPKQRRERPYNLRGSTLHGFEQGRGFACSLGWV